MNELQVVVAVCTGNVGNFIVTEDLKALWKRWPAALASSHVIIAVGSVYPNDGQIDPILVGRNRTTSPQALGSTQLLEESRGKR